MPLKQGDKAPAFTLLDQDENKVTLSGFKGRRVLVYFYPKADTPGCTTQACGLRDVLPQVGDTVVLGISPDKPAKQKKFDDKYSLGFPLLADEDHAVAEAFEVWTEKSTWSLVAFTYWKSPRTRKLSVMKCLKPADQSVVFDDCTL
jgi:peroxiredoxin Q/BCP